MPNLIKVQKDSYNWFVNEGLGEVLREVSPIVDYSENLVLDFLDYHMDEETKYTVDEAKERDATYSTKLHVKVRLFNRETGEIKEQVIYLGDFPVMTETGTFIIRFLQDSLYMQSHSARGTIQPIVLPSKGLRIIDLCPRFQLRRLSMTPPRECGD